MSLTSAGHALLGPARRIRRSTRQAEAAVSTEPSRRAARLDLAVLSPALNTGLAEVIGAFVREHPEVILQVHELRSELDAVEVLSSGAAEVVVALLPLEVGRAGDRLATMELGTYDIHVAHPPLDAAMGVRAIPAMGQPVAMADLNDVPLALMPRRPIMSANMAAMMDEAGPQIRPRAIVGQWETRTAWMLQGIASTLLGSRSAEFARACGATIAPLRGATGLTVGIAWDPQSLSPVGARFIAQAEASGSRSTAAPSPPETTDQDGRPDRSGDEGEDRPI